MFNEQAFRRFQRQAGKRRSAIHSITLPCPLSARMSSPLTCGSLNACLEQRQDQAGVSRRQHLATPLLYYSAGGIAITEPFKAAQDHDLIPKRHEHRLV
jgi:hypothetical protein